MGKNGICDDSFSRQDKNELLTHTQPSTPVETSVEREAQENNLAVSPDSEVKLKFTEELCRQDSSSRHLATEIASSEGSEEKVIEKLKKCRVKLVRLTDKELKLYTRQKLTKKIKEVWIENKVKQRKGSLRVAIKESLKMKNEVEAKNNESRSDVKSKLKKPAEKMKSTQKKKTSKNEAKVEKVKTLIDPQA